MDTISKTKDFLQFVSKEIGLQRKKQFEFAFQSISLHPIDSLNANARINLENTKTAESKIYRILHNNHFLNELPLLIKRLNLVNVNDLINVDFSDFGNGMQVLMFAKQTKQGRAIPIYFEVLQYPIKKGSQNIFIVEAINNLIKILEFKVRLVFDRGFACPYIVENLNKNRVIYYLRIKKDKHVLLPRQKKKASCKVNKKDQKVFAYNNDCRLIRSEKPKIENQPWYIITNDFESTREEIIKIYYHRFEIEELFKDAKHIFKLEQINFKRKESLTITLWFVLIGIWLIWYLKEHIKTIASCFVKRKDGKQELSLIRYCFEEIHRRFRQEYLKFFVL